MLKRLSLASFIVFFGFWSAVQPASGQALVPHILQLDPARLERQGIGLAQEAAQLATFEQYELAIPRAQLATQLAPKNANVWSLLGGLYLQTNELDRGIETLKKAQALDGKDTAVLFALGSAYFQKADYAASVRYLTAGLKIKPNVTGALFDLGNAYLMLNQYADAIAQYEKAVATEKEFWPAINNIGLIKYEQGDLEAAMQYWRQAVKLDQKAAEPQLAIASHSIKRAIASRHWQWAKPRSRLIAAMLI